MTRIRFLRLLGGLALLVCTQELALRAVIDHEVAGALLAGGATTPVLAGAGATLLLRLFTYAAIAIAPAILAYRIAARRPTSPTGARRASPALRWLVDSFRRLRSLLQGARHPAR